MLEKLRELRDFYRGRLLDNCLPFWIQHAIDESHGGFVTSLDRDGTVIDTDKNAWQQGRFTWLLAELFNDPDFDSNTDNECWLRIALHGADFIENHCFDAEDGRMWFHLDQQGNPIRKRRYAFSESFAAIAFGELAKATGDPKFKELAIRCFSRFVEHNSTPDSANAKFTNHRPMRSLGIPMITIVTAQELRDSVGLENADDVILESIGSIRRYFVKPELGCVLETCGENGEVVDHFDGRTLNPGHALEAAWFVMEEGRIQSDQSLVELGTNMLDWMFQRGWDEQHGGILYFVDVHGLPVQEYWHDMKFWWPQNETIIATLLAYELTSEQRYLDMHSQIHQWAFDRFEDPEHGEWFGYLHRDGTPSSSLKGNHWKGPFHYPRMLLQCVRILNRILSA